MTDLQKSMLGEYHFRVMQDGIFHCYNRDFSGTPADLSLIFGVEVPCWTQFLRVINWDDMIYFEYRSYDSRTCRINIKEKEEIK